MDKNIYKNNIKMVKYTSLIHTKVSWCSSRWEEERDFSCGLGYHSKVAITGLTSTSRQASEVKIDHHLCLQLILLGKCVRPKHCVCRCLLRGPPLWSSSTQDCQSSCSSCSCVASSSTSGSHLLLPLLRVRGGGWPRQQKLLVGER